MTCYAHGKEGLPEDQWQTLADHLANAARLAEEKAQAFGAGAWGRAGSTCSPSGGARAEPGKARGRENRSGPYAPGRGLIIFRWGARAALHGQPLGGGGAAVYHYPGAPWPLSGHHDQ